MGGQTLASSNGEERHFLVQWYLRQITEYLFEPNHTFGHLLV